MGQLLKGETFSNGEQVTALRLNQLVDSATLTTGAITEQANLTPNTLAADDSLLAYDTSANGLREITASDVLNSGLPITTGSITGNSGSNLIITPHSTSALLVSGNLSTTNNLSVTGNVTANGTLTVIGNATFNTSEAIKLPVGTTAQRPVVPVAGDIRFNTTTTNTEFYNGSAWESSDPVEAVSLTANGYIKLANGLILQWGTNLVAMANYSVATVTFPIAFPNACFNVQLTARAVTPVGGGATLENGIKLNGVPTTTNFSVYVNWAGSGAGATIYPVWFAIGN